MKAFVLAALHAAADDPARALAAIEPLRLTSPEVFGTMNQLITAGNTPSAVEFMQSVPPATSGAVVLIVALLLIALVAVPAFVWVATR